MCVVNNKIINKLINSFIKDGKKLLSEKKFKFILYELKRLYGKKYFLVLISAIENLIPVLKLKNKKKAGIQYKVPCSLKDDEGLSYALKWFRVAVRERKELKLEVRIVNELIDAYNKKGNAMKKKSYVYELATSNRNFIKFLR